MNKKILVSIIGIIFVFSVLFFNNVNATFYPYVKDVGKAKLIRSVKDFKTAESEHFILKYTPRDEKYTSLVLDIAERHFKGVTEDLGYVPREKVLIVMYSDADKMNRDFSLAKGTTAMGLYLNGVISIQSPSLWIGDEDNLPEIFEKEGPIVHEFAHFIVDEVAKGNYPVWFTEGIALLEEYRENEVSWGEGLKGKPYSLEELNYKFNELDEVLAYKRSFEILKAMSYKYGMESIREIIKYLGEGLSLEESFYKVTGDTLKNFIDSIK
ncbi:MAG: hypothetical protein PWQ34_998 [Caldanaerobacter sp.]|jgi:hypothetical protein|uniref:hypothetical protein n=1 Tax=Caldanaerobacter sp. TaxID=2930036 RepID=UPI0024AC2383|nr:hypothetical protein [Caldanaerobacter sp.]MDI3518851.1 hypothetical protein [Caldanaerobacter sp.]